MRILRPLLIAALLASAPAFAKAPAVKPGLWKLSDADTTIYLFGTVHALPRNYKWRSPLLNKALARSDRLVVEAVLDQDPQQVATLLVTTGRKSGLPPLVERVSARLRPDLDATIKKVGVQPGQLDGYKTWAAAMLLMGGSLKGLSVTAEDGVEPQLEADFRRAGKPIEGLETASQQLGYFNTMSEAAQRQFLESVLEPDGETKQEFDAMLAAWSSGRDRAIAKSFDQELKASPVLKTVLVDRRNADWAAAIAKRMDQPGTSFIAVGAGHLAGAGAVQALLRQRGFTVQRIQ